MTAEEYTTRRAQILADLRRNGLAKTQQAIGALGPPPAGVDVPVAPAPITEPVVF